MNMQGLTLIIVVSLLSLAFVFAFIRMVCGPSLPDRVVALDLMSTVAIGIIGIYAIATGEPVFLDVAIILALVAFLGTIAFSYYLIRISHRENAEER
ncbi:monovalent cation/H+ antiporter complex subunit F [Desulforhabdus amnigena]|uniref:Cation:proton antiporter n=1 Tax=Desulforhabdus amnigena TaxID=40218 RepID=A0A9W6FWL1_9BACT|nr:monovalent cation/H+ antiporter complex subunit F [Desulforhabdus amnigena]NLJ28303.1 cation:proton antiporter [Deltaproteobacteria bacterium]GLI36221.1 cation:proton antiporter [Desulforhabdus amnigena]